MNDLIKNEGVPAEEIGTPFVYWHAPYGTLFVWSGVYDEFVGMLIHADNVDEYPEEFRNRSTMPENEFFEAAKPPFEFEDRKAKYDWFIERCIKNWITGGVDDFDLYGIPDYYRQSTKKGGRA